MKIRYALPFFAAAFAFAQAPPIRLSPIRLNVDASDAPQRLLHATMQFPVKPGPMSLLYPKWIAGEHCADRTDRGSRRHPDDREWQGRSLASR